MAYLAGFGKYLPARVVSNEEIGALVGCDSAWIRGVAGIVERRFADGETVEDMAVQAGEDCLGSTTIPREAIGAVLVSSGSAERQFPGPAAAVAHRLGCANAVAVDIPMASAGTLFAMNFALRTVADYKHVLVIGAEKMSSILMRQPMERGVAILFGDGAGACLVSAESGIARIVDAAIHSDGSFAGDLKLEYGKPLEMNGRSVILQASRKIPAAIQALLDRTRVALDSVDVFLMHQANQNLIVRVADSLGVAPEKFFSNISRYGNTSSASMLIAAAEWAREIGFHPGRRAMFAAFGAGFHWGALLAEGV